MDKERERIRREVFDKPKDLIKGQLSSSEEVLKNSPEVNPKLLEMFPEERLKKIKAKELRRYKEKQDLKWERWLESVSK